MQSIEVQSEKTPIGLVRRATSRKRSYTALVVRTAPRWAQGFVAPTGEGFTGRGFEYQGAVSAAQAPAAAASTARPAKSFRSLRGRSEELDHFGQACKAEANGSASVSAPAPWRREGRKRSSRHLAALRSVVSNPSVNR